jgi:hypothetical protein
MNTINTILAACPAGNVTLDRCTTNAEAEYLRSLGYTMHRSYWAGEVWGRGAPSTAYDDGMGQWRKAGWLPANAGM